MGIRVEIDRTIVNVDGETTHDVPRGASEAFSLSSDVRVFVLSREKHGSEIGVVSVANRGKEQVIVQFQQGKGEPPVINTYSDPVTVEKGQAAALAYAREEIRETTIKVFHTDGEVRLEPLPIGSPEPVAA